jgi:hypothetical protein
MLSIPTYISTSWTYVDGLYMKGATLVIILFGGESVNVPGLKPEIIEAVFVAHAEFLEQEVSQQSLTKQDSNQLMSLPFGLPLFSQALPMFTTGDSAFQFGISSMEGFGTAMQHNPTQSDAPDLPLEILQKISAIVKIVAPEEVVSGVAAVQDCNCPHCQITRAIQGSNEIENYHEIRKLPTETQEKITQHFQIQQIGEELYTVTDSQDVSKTEYKVFLGRPVGCTCGKEGCVHLVAVLRS